MSTWIILSWVGVALMTAVNVFIFIKLKQASEQMLKMAFPNSRGMGDAMAQMQQMMSAMGMGGAGGPMGGMGGANMDAQMKAAMKMLGQMGAGQPPGGQRRR